MNENETSIPTVDDIRSVRSDIETKVHNGATFVTVAGNNVWINNDGIPVPAHSAGDLCTSVSDGFLMTIGNRFKNRPDILFMVGPAINEQMTVAQLCNEMRCLHTIISSMSGESYDVEWLTGVNIHKSPTGRCYQSVEMSHEAIACCKATTASILGKLYGCEDYDLVVIFPVDRLMTDEDDNPSVH